jgi:hypothetical protein
VAGATSLSSAPLLPRVTARATRRPAMATTRAVQGASNRLLHIMLWL